MENSLLYGITPDEFFEKLCTIVRGEIKAEIKHNKLLTKDRALKIAGISNATFMK